MEQTPKGISTDVEQEYWFSDTYHDRIERLFDDVQEKINKHVERKFAEGIIKEDDIYAYFFVDSEAKPGETENDDDISIPTDIQISIGVHLPDVMADVYDDDFINKDINLKDMIYEAVKDNADFLSHAASQLRELADYIEDNKKIY